MHYWIRTDKGKEFGPFTMDQLREFASKGRVKASTQLRRDDSNQWEPALRAIAAANVGASSTSRSTVRSGPSGASAPARASGALAAPAAPAAEEDPFAQFMSASSPGASAGARAGAIDTMDPGAAAWATPPTIPVPTQYGRANYAGFFQRLAAYLLDWIMISVAVFALAIAVGVVLAVVLGGNDPKAAQRVGFFTGLLANVAIVFVGWLYFAMLESSAKQATIGKRLLGIVVTDEHGQRISFVRATGRYFAKVLSSIMLVGYIMAAFMPKKQALHDLIAGTSVRAG
ncbi:MAG: RDD family protein [Phycisphaerales bacterium]